MEQIASRVMSIASMKDVLQAFKVKGLPSDRAMRARCTKDIARLKKLQHSVSASVVCYPLTPGVQDGWFSYWKPSDETVSVHLTIHVAHVIAVCAEKQYGVHPQDLIVTQLRYVIEDWQITQRCRQLDITNRSAICFLRAFALFVKRKLTPDADFSATIHQILDVQSDLKVGL